MHSSDFGSAVVGALFFGIPIVWIIAHYCHLTVKAWQETSLKRDMVARGYTANEIIDVMSGARSQADGLRDVPPAKPIKQPV
jgi:hypothetical protein